MKNLLNIQEINRENLINLWINGKEFNRWLLKWYILISENWKDSYISYVMNTLSSFSDEEFVEALWFKIFDFSEEPKETWYKERKEYLKEFYRSNKITVKIEEELRKRLEQIKDINKDINRVLRFITGISC